MKNFKNAWMLASLVIGVLFIISCEKSEIVTETIELSKEGLENELGVPDQVSNEQESEAMLPVLHMSFDKNMSPEEVKLTWNKAVKDYTSKKPIEKRVESGFNYTIYTQTGNEAENGTTDSVEAWIVFRLGNNIDGHPVTNHHLRVSLEHDDGASSRGQGQFDFYLFESILLNNVPDVSWVEVDQAFFGVIGSDNWFPTLFQTFVAPEWQNRPATGAAFLISYPNVWIERSLYYTENDGFGRLNF